MDSKNEVTLTFAGESDKLEKSFDNVGSAAKEMDGKVGTASRNVGDSFDRAGQAADNVDTKAMGFRDTITGVQDTMKGLSDDSLGLGERLVTFGMGVGDLASGMFNFIIPAMKSFTLSTLSNIRTTVTSTATNAVHKVGLIASTVATKAMTLAQRGLNLAMRANPIGIIITLLAAVGAGLVIAYKKSETFRNIVNKAFDVVKRAAQFAWNVIKNHPLVLLIRNFDKVKDAASGVGRAIKSAFRGAFRSVRSFWNSTAGGFGFTIPGWVPFVGGNSFRIPRMHTGGIVPGAAGQEVLTMLEAGERVTPAGRSGGRTVIELRSDGSRLGDLLVELLRNLIRAQGGDVQVVLGS